MSSNASLQKIKEGRQTKYLRVFPAILKTFNELIETTFWRAQEDRHTIRRQVNAHNVIKLCDIIEPFQEEPHLLDKDLKRVLPSLVRVLAASMEMGNYEVPPGYFIAREAVGRLLYTLCKIRGNAVIVRFLPHEPRYIEPLLDTFELHDKHSELRKLHWKDSFALILWLSELVLTPFDLSSISSDDPSIVIRPVGLELPPGLPQVVVRILPIAFDYINSPGRDRDTAARLLARLSMRPDMRQLGLLPAIAKWAIETVGTPLGEESADIYRSIGALMVLKVLASTAATAHIGEFSFRVFTLCRHILENGETGQLGNSALAQKLAVKVVRHLAVHYIRFGDRFDQDESSELIEGSIGLLINSLSSGDTPVRLAASKSLSYVTAALDQEMANDVIDDVVQAYSDNVLWEHGRMNTNAVNAMRWHGLTLTLAHLLYRRALSENKLGVVINSLLQALNFEQRSATGVSMGTNVRDAACFGLWAMSRRYRTDELLKVNTSQLRSPTCEITPGSTLFHIVSQELVAVACLDPVGNIRRGCSAALQELIGRHPNTVEEGITLIQIVDYLAVGLHERALTEILKAASLLSVRYWQSLFSGIFQWKCLFSNDEKTRQMSANSLSILLEGSPLDEVTKTLSVLVDKTRQLKPRQVEERHGLLLSVAAVMRTHSRREDASEVAISWLSTAQGLLVELDLQENDFTSNVLRPRLTTISILPLLDALGSAIALHDLQDKLSSLSELLRDLFYLALRQANRGMKTLITSAARSVILSLQPVPQRLEMLVMLMAYIADPTEKSNPYYLALGSLMPLMHDHIQDGKELMEKLSSKLARRYYSYADIETKLVALESIHETFEMFHTRELTENHRAHLVQVIKLLADCLDDYTVTGSGDVGSHIRFEALRLLQTLLSTVELAEICTEGDGEILFTNILAMTVGISVERLDKGRLQASTCLAQLKHSSEGSGRVTEMIGRFYERVSTILSESQNLSSATHECFFLTLGLLSADVPETIQVRLVEGLSGSTSSGGEDLIRDSRRALIRYLSVECEGMMSVKERRERFLYLLVRCLKGQRQTKDGKFSWNDRVATGLFELLTFVFEMDLYPTNLPGAMSSGTSKQEDAQSDAFTTPSFPGIVALVQSFHFRSQNIQKLRIAIDCYRALASCGRLFSVEGDGRDDYRIRSGSALVQLANLLLHPFPRVRFAAAESLWVIRQGLHVGSGSGGGEMDRMYGLLFDVNWLEGLDERAYSVHEKDPARLDLTIRQAGKMIGTLAKEMVQAC